MKEQKEKGKKLTVSESHLLRLARERGIGWVKKNHKENYQKIKDYI